MNLIINFLKRNIYWTIAFALVFSFVIIIQFVVMIRHSPMRVFVEEEYFDDAIVFRITKVEETTDYYIVEGYAYDPRSITKYVNYVSGSGESYPVDLLIFLSGSNQDLAYFTSPISVPGIIDEELRSVHYTGFHTKIAKNLIPNRWDGKIGVILEKDNQITFSKLDEIGVNHE